MAKIRPISETHYFNDFISTSVMKSALHDVNSFITPIFNSPQGKRLSTKTKSELISVSLEYAFTHHLSLRTNLPVSSASSDNDPDIILGDRIAGAEIKVASCSLDKSLRGNVSWRGGSFSKRAGDYLLISWATLQNKLSFFVAYSNLQESDWNESSSKNYYATEISVSDLISKHSPIILIGNTTTTPKGHNRLLLECFS